MLAVKITAKKDLKSWFTEVLETVPAVTETSVQSITDVIYIKHIIAVLTHGLAQECQPAVGTEWGGDRALTLEYRHYPAAGSSWKKDSVSSEQTTEATIQNPSHPDRQELLLSDAPYKSKLLQK